ncbi:hypothetical protein [uncultured Campylobacter sp.]|uniref:hypothetical protein n=1 Tax=uncultured Campylobacter sp. TaxID=218934 RepID=UPI00263535DA|nr:hypothetical protein [uncultured Campylobacter sp.]
MDEKYYNDIKNFIDEHFDVVPTWLMKKAYYNEENMNDLYEMTVSDDEPDSMLPDREVMYVSEDTEMDKFITENVEKVSKMGFRIFQIDVEDRILLGSDQWQINDKGQTFYEASVAPLMEAFNSYQNQVEDYSAVEEIKAEISKNSEKKTSVDTNKNSKKNLAK